MMPLKLGKSIKILLDIITLYASTRSLYVRISHPVLSSQPSISTWIMHIEFKATLKTEYDIVLAKLQDRCCKLGDYSMVS